METTLLTIHTIIDAPIKVVWNKWTNPDDIVKWNNASDDWHTTRAVNDLRVDGKFLSRMEAKNGSTGFDFEGTYNSIKPYELIEYTLDDNRKVRMSFKQDENKTQIVGTFEPENTNSLELQQSGWQAILDNFKKYTESKKNS